MIFRDRKEAGKQLSLRLKKYKDKKNILVLGLARGGVVVAAEIARNLSLPLNVLVPRKIGAPGNPEVAIGAVSEEGEIYLKSSVIAQVEASPVYIEEEAKKERQAAIKRASLYREKAPLEDLKDKTILLVDDGIATGSTMLVEIQSLRKKGVKQIVVAVPVAAIDAWTLMEKLADEAVCLSVEEHLFGISQFYDDFSQVSDQEVIELLT